MKKLVTVILLLVILAGGWFFVSPLFIDREVDEPLDFLAADGSVDLSRVMAMPEAMRREKMPDIMAAAANAPDRASADGMPQDAPTVVASGNFVDADAIHKGSGKALLYGLPDGRHLLRFEDFRATNGPALVVYLAKHAAPQSADDVTDHGFIQLGKLKGNVGNQNYSIPQGIEVSEYNSVVIWCELFGVLFSPAALTRL